MRVDSDGCEVSSDAGLVGEVKIDSGVLVVGIGDRYHSLCGADGIDEHPADLGERRRWDSDFGCQATGLAVIHDGQTVQPCPSSCGLCRGISKNGIGTRSSCLDRHPALVGDLEIRRCDNVLGIDLCDECILSRTVFRLERRDKRKIRGIDQPRDVGIPSAIRC